MPADLDRDECWRLLCRAAVGRVAVIRGALPSIVPVNVCALDEALWFRVGPGVLLDAALNGDIVSVEADEVDRVAHAGWSVVVTGRAEVAAERDDVPVSAWGRPDADHLVRVAGSIVTGRRL
jgi:nitroimidazol reductase NimA-like FMN-containing flavoprotein (pyridoxamine 5'-phosphate oxidase superfamily)